MNDEHTKNGLFPPKLVATVTDNASNFKKAFKEFGVEVDSVHVVHELEEESALPEEEELDVVEMPEGDLAGENDQPHFSLPPQQKCAAHTMSLISINALKNAEMDNTFKKLNRSMMGKVTALWNKVSRSPAASERAFNILKRHFVSPCPTRWNSLYDSLQFINQQNQSSLDQVFDQLELPKLTSLDRAFLSELLETLKPVSFTLDHLQAGDERSALGYLIPRIYELNDKITSQIWNNPIHHLSPQPSRKQS